MQIELLEKGFNSFILFLEFFFRTIKKCNEFKDQLTYFFINKNIIVYLYIIRVFIRIY